MNTAHNPVVRMRRTPLAVAISLLALAVSATALAGNGYRLAVGDANTRVASGRTFTVIPHGIAAHRARLYLYLDRQACRVTWAGEAKRFRTFHAGQSYFRNTGKAVARLWVSGHFDKAFYGIAGTTAERENVCAYLTTPSSSGAYRVTAAVGSIKYFVTG